VETIGLYLFLPSSLVNYTINFEAMFEIAKPILANVGEESGRKTAKINYTFLQLEYLRKGFEDQQPCFMTIQRSKPHKRRNIVPPMLLL